mmetsp:Transcript_49148/g.131956  ORF Transcript_49148/g.131956 Transcript_49148/m.131956 type:complete len:235 (-) Transcript_49148:316-1020(-)
MLAPLLPRLHDRGRRRAAALPPAEPASRRGGLWGGLPGGGLRRRGHRDFSGGAAEVFRLGAWRLPGALPAAAAGRRRVGSWRGRRRAGAVLAGRALFHGRAHARASQPDPQVRDNRHEATRIRLPWDVQPFLRLPALPTDFRRGESHEVEQRPLSARLCMRWRRRGQRSVLGAAEGIGLSGLGAEVGEVHSLCGLRHRPLCALCRRVLPVCVLCLGPHVLRGPCAGLVHARGPC